MVLTKYHISFEAVEGNIILFNTYNGKMISLEKKIYRMLNNKEFSILEELEEEDKKFIIENFIEKNYEDEQDKLTHHMKALKKESDLLTVTILTNLDCNMECKYCHESGFLTKEYLNSEVQNKILKWVEEKCKNSRYKKVLVYFYGGEPLLNVESIDYISKGLKKILQNRGVELELAITTNGTLLTEEIMSKFKEINLKSIQVSIDGNEEIHNYRRPLINGENSYQIIFDKLEKYSNEFYFHVRVNVDKHNYKSIEQLMDELVKRKLEKKVNFYMDFVSSTHKKNNHCDNYVFTTTEEMKKIVYLWQRQIEKNIPLNGKNIIEGLCGNISDSNITIHPNGDLYICPGLCGIDELKIGNVEKGENKFFKELIEEDIWENCLDCPYIPMCAGGCRAQAYMESGSCLKCSCKRAYYEFAVPKYLSYKYGF